MHMPVLPVPARSTTLTPLSPSTRSPPQPRPPPSPHCRILRLCTTFVSAPPLPTCMCHMQHQGCTAPYFLSYSILGGSWDVGGRPVAQRPWLPRR